MAIVPKIDPKGIDAVIDAIQNYIFPLLSGAGWTNYTCYPRANKNIRNDNVLPEVSRDVKNYLEVLNDDKVNATSFFLPSDTAPFDNDERWILRDLDIIFQVELPKLFPLVTDHRADEELHAQIMQILTANEELFVDVVGYEIGIDNVYSGLSLSTAFKAGIELDDIGKFHFVKFTVTVKYPADDCEITYSPTCDAAVYRNSNDSFVQVIASGDSFVAPDVTITVAGTPNVIPANEDAAFPGTGNPVTTDFNDTPTGVDTPSGENLDINVVDIVGNPIGTLEVNSANEKEIEVLYPNTTTDVNGTPTGVETGAGQNISFHVVDANVVDVPGVLIVNTVNEKFWQISLGPTFTKLITGQIIIDVDGDDGWRADQGEYLGGFLVDKYTLAVANEWGHFKNFTGNTGGYMDENSGVFFDKDAVVTTKALAFPNDIERDYNLRIKRYLLRTLVTEANWSTQVLAMKAATVGGESEWRIGTLFEFQARCTHGDEVSTFLDGRMFNYSGNVIWTGTTVKNDRTKAFRFNNVDQGTARIAKTTALFSGYIKNF